MRDSDISVRRKIAFLINGLLLPSSTSTSSTVASSSADAQQQAGDAPTPVVHANTHASMLSDPQGAQTSDITLNALTQNGILSALISALVDPVPHGPDGETEGDVDLEEKIVRCVLTLYIPFILYGLLILMWVGF